jgi:hypothetical protein
VYYDMKLYNLLRLHSDEYDIVGRAWMKKGEGSIGELLWSNKVYSDTSGNCQGERRETAHCEEPVSPDVAGQRLGIPASKSGDAAVCLSGMKFCVDLLRPKKLK